MKNLIHFCMIVLLATFTVMIALKMSVAQDPIKVSPHTHKVLLENERVRVMEYRSQPGEKSPMHSYSEVVIYRLSPSYKLKLTFPDGKTEVIEGKVGDVRWDKGLREIENVGNTEAHAVIVELKVPLEK
jgi:beta-alanine degradation protein BauB